MSHLNKKRDKMNPGKMNAQWVVKQIGINVSYDHITNYVKEGCKCHDCFLLILLGVSVCFLCFLHSLILYLVTYNALTLHTSSF